MMRNAIRGCSTLSMFSAYNEQYSNKILSALNSGNEELYKKFSLSKTKAQKLKKFVQNTGPVNVSSLPEVIKVLDMDEGSFIKFCNIILHGDNFYSMNKVRTSSIVLPNEGNFQGLNSCVGLFIGNNLSLTWTHISKEFEMNGWGHTETTGTQMKKITPNSMFDIVQNACEELPLNCDAFVMETIPAILPQQVYIQSYILKREVQATLLALLNSRLPRQNRVFFIQPRIVSRLFEIQVGSERVSAQPILEKMLHGEGVGPSKSFLLNSIPSEFQVKFKAESGPTREAHSNALLLAMTFLKLAVNNDTSCLAALKLI